MENMQEGNPKAMIMRRSNLFWKDCRLKTNSLSLKLAKLVSAKQAKWPKRWIVIGAKTNKNPWKNAYMVELILYFFENDLTTVNSRL